MNHTLLIEDNFNSRSISLLKMKGVSVWIYACLSHPADLTLGGCNAEHPRKSSVECEEVWVNSSQAAIPEAKQTESPEQAHFEYTLH